jgi:hypothetical protein
MSGILRRDITIPQAGDALIDMIVRTARPADRGGSAWPPRIRDDQTLSQRVGGRSRQFVAPLSRAAQVIQIRLLILS